MTDDEIRELKERLKIEYEIRDSLKEKNELFSIWKIFEKIFNSSLITLFIGGVFTYIYLPKYQNEQKNLDWHNQIMYDSFKITLAEMRSGLKSFIDTELYVDKYIELLSEIKSTDSIIGINKLLESFNKVQNDRIEKNREVFTKTPHYDTVAGTFSEALNEDIEIHIKKVDNFSEKIRHVLILKIESLKNKNSSNNTQINSLYSEIFSTKTNINDSYKKIVHIMRNEVSFIKKQYERGKLGNI